MATHNTAVVPLTASACLCVRFSDHVCNFDKEIGANTFFRSTFFFSSLNGVESDSTPQVVRKQLLISALVRFLVVSRTFHLIQREVGLMSVFMSFQFKCVTLWSDPAH